MHRRLRYALAALALTAAAALAFLTGTLDDILTPADTTWGSHTTDTSVGVNTTPATPQDTYWG